ncbi:hypothetical protein HY483_02185 [Candidatus Woesearchaeota archaeon]|nr:hypothetical protein [Candidatus Woesearchaeota archaeon]
MMITRRNKRHSKVILEKSMDALGLRKDMKTNPRIMLSLLKEMKIDDFETTFLPMRDFFDEIISKPQQLRYMFNSIQQGIINKHPAIVDFAEVALARGWLKESRHVYRSAHITFLLERITVAMCNNHPFFMEIHDHIRAKERAYGFDSKHILRTCMRIVAVTHDMFDTAKIMSVDPAMIYFRISRGLGKSSFGKEELKKLCEDGELNYLEYKLLCPKKRGLSRALELLQINIYEAGITEYKRGLKTNSICAFELNEDVLRNPPRAQFKKGSVLPENVSDTFYESVVSKGNIFPTFSLSQRWVSLYGTWNMTFILGNMDELDLLFPKLFIPSLINAKTENAGGVRLISLWISVNNFFFRKCDRIRTVQGPRKKEVMARAWAEINKKYAFDLAKRETREDSNVLMEHYNRMFSRPIYNLFKLFIAFFR